jgi:hypothetical protein
MQQVPKSIDAAWEQNGDLLTVEMTCLSQDGSERASNSRLKLAPESLGY